MSATQQERYSARTSARYSARSSSAEIEVDRRGRPQTVDRRDIHLASLPSRTLHSRTLKEAAAGAETAPLPSITRTRLPSWSRTDSSLKVDHRPRGRALRVTIRSEDR